MASTPGVEDRFREHVRRERERREWTQADLAKRLHANGLEHIIASTVAKIEAGTRAVRIDEANVIANVFETSVDALMGRTSLDDGGNLANEVRMAERALIMAQIDIQSVAASLAATALALRAVAGWQPTGGAAALMDGCQRATDVLVDVDRILNEALVSGVEETE